MHAIDYRNCPHCIQSYGEGEYDYENTGCDECNQTGYRKMTLKDVLLFASASEWMNDKVEDAFSDWIVKVKQNHRGWYVDKYELNEKYVQISAQRYSGCNEYDRENFEMPIEYLIEK